MNISIILAHPDRTSFNQAIARTATDHLQTKGHDVIFHDLYDEGFDPVLPAYEIPTDAPIPKEIEPVCNEIASAQGIIIVHPNWWGQPPAILKGWVDRVIRPDVAYKFPEDDKGEGIPVGLLNTKAVIVFNTSNTSAEREASVFGDPLETLWKNCIFGLCGVKTFYRKMFGIVVTSTPQQRKEWLENVREVLDRYF